VLLLKPLDTRGLGLPAGTDAQIPQVAEQGDSVIVAMGLLGGNGAPTWRQASSSGSASASSRISRAAPLPQEIGICS